MSLPSSKYKKDLVKIKNQLIFEITTYLKDGRFDMSRTSVIYQKIPFGDCFRCEFDFIRGDEHAIKLYKKDLDFIPQMGFVKDEEAVVDDEIAPLMALLDHISMDKHNK